MSLNSLMQRGRTVAEYGHALAERVPYGLVALVSRFAVASVFWRSGQTKVHGFHIREETFVLFREAYKGSLAPARRSGIRLHDGRARFSGIARYGPCLAALRLWPVVHDDGDTAVRLSERLARSHSVDRHSPDHHRARPWSNLSRSSLVGSRRRNAGFCQMTGPVLRTTSGRR
jgi:hypothetical protein